MDTDILTSDTPSFTIRANTPARFANHNGNNTGCFLLSGIPVVKSNELYMGYILMDGVPFIGHIVSIDVNHNGGIQTMVKNEQTEMGFSFKLIHPDLKDGSDILRSMDDGVVNAKPFAISWVQYDDLTGQDMEVMIDITPMPRSNSLEITYSYEPAKKEE